MQKMERERRMEFIRKATGVVCEEIVKSLDGCRNQVNISIKTGQGGRHRYIDVKRYKDGVGVSIYNDGNIDVTLREMVYEEVKFPLIRYNEMEERGSALDQLRDAVAAFLEVFFHGGMHALMYYMCECKYGSDWKECLADYKGTHAPEKESE